MYRPSLRAALTLLPFLGLACSGGADLSKGGVELTWALDRSAPADGLAEARAIAAARLKNARIPAVVKEAGGRISVKIPRSVAGRVEDVKTLIGMRGQVELREVDDALPLLGLTEKLPPDGSVAVDRETWEANHKRQTNLIMLASSLEIGAKAFATLGDLKLPRDVKMVPDVPNSNGVRYYALKPAAFTLDNVTKTFVPQEPYMPPEVTFKLDEKSAEAYKQFTGRIVGKKMAIVIDGVVRQTEVVANASGVGTFGLALPGNAADRDQRQMLVSLMSAAFNAGPMPAALTLESERPF